MKGKKHTPEQIIGKLREADAELNSGGAGPEYEGGAADPIFSPDGKRVAYGVCGKEAHKDFDGHGRHP